MKSVNLKKVVIPISAIVILTLFSIIITGFFLEIQNKIYDQVLKYNISRLDGISKKIITAIHSEINHSVYMLETIAEMIEIDLKKLSLEENLNNLKQLENKGYFDSLGLISNSGEMVETDGFYEKINHNDLAEVYTKLSQDKYYVSDILINKDNNISEEILIAIPFLKNKEINGIIFGHYPIENIVKNIALSEDEQEYFQIIDTKGQYISRSDNKNSLAGREFSFWEEIEKYRYFNGTMLDKIKTNVEEQKKGNFYFEFEGRGRYVIYEPLNINNWYIFSVLTKNKLELDISRIQSLSKDVLVYFIIVNIFIVVTIIGVAQYLYTLLREQSKKIEIKNNMLRLLVQKTDDIIFEVHFKENKFFYYKNIEERNTECYFSVTTQLCSYKK